MSTITICPICGEEKLDSVCCNSCGEHIPRPRVRKLFVFPMPSGEDYTVEFIKIYGMPGWSHKVIINGRHHGAGYWLHVDFKPNAKAARFYLAKHLGIER